MSKVQLLRGFISQRLTAAAEEIFGLFERTISEYEQEVHRQRRLLEGHVRPEVNRDDVYKFIVSKEELPPEQQEWSPSLDQEDPEPLQIKEEMSPSLDQEDPEPLQIKEEMSLSLDQEDPQLPHIKEEQEELWNSSQEGEQLPGLEEADITKFPFTPVPMKSEEDDEEKPQSSQLHQSQTEQMEADGEDCGGPEPARNSDPDRLLQPGTGDSFEPERKVSGVWKETRGPQSGLNVLKNNEVPASEIRFNKGGKSFRCTECGKIFSQNSNLKTHMRVHTGEKPFSCSVCGKSFTQKVNMIHHMARHTGYKLVSCSVCDERFTWLSQLKNHKCVGRQSSQPHQSQTEQMEAKANGEDCGGPEPARNSDPDRLLQPETGDSFEPERKVSGVWKETRGPQSGLNVLKNNEVPASEMRFNKGGKSFRCTECGKRFNQNSNLKTHMRVHTGEKPFSCSVCGKRFVQKVNLTHHMAHHTGYKLVSCSVCDERFTWLSQLKNHKCVGLQSSQLHQSQTEQMEAKAHGEDCGGPEPAKNSDPDRLLQPQTGDSSEPERKVSDDWKETRGPQSGLNVLKNNEVPASEMRFNKGGKSFRCTECGKRFNQNSNLKTHMRVHTGEKPFSCSVCGKRFVQKVHLTHHMAHHTGYKLVSCSICDERFTWLSQLKNHKCVGLQSSQLHQSQTEQMEAKAHGEDCGGPEPDRNSDPDRLLQPETEVSVSDVGLNTDKPFSCSECGKTFGRKTHLREHLRCHTGEKPFCCSICKKCFSWRRHLKRHMRIHTGEKRLSCSVCDKMFNWPYQLKIHQCVGESSQLHQRQTQRQAGDGDVGRNTMKLFSCSWCGKVFGFNDSLQRHVRCHTGEKPFSCSVCGRRFGEKGNLRQHMVVHTGEKPFSCSVCDQRFSWRKQLKKHKCVGEAAAGN